MGLAGTHIRSMLSSVRQYIHPHSSAPSPPNTCCNVRWAEAKDAFERSLELDAGNAEGWLGLGRVCMATGSEEDAEQHYSRFVTDWVEYEAKMNR